MSDPVPTEIAKLLQAGKLEQSCPACGGPRDRRAVLCQPCRRADNRTFTPDRIRQRLDAQTVVMPSGCWEWTGARTAAGYGEITLKGYRGKRNHLVHRLSFELAHGPISDGLHIRHTCDNPPCRNPDHLLEGTAADNSADMVARGRSVHRVFEVCKRGHAFQEGRRKRQGCQACRTALQRERRAVYGRPDRATAKP